MWHQDDRIEPKERMKKGIRASFRRRLVLWYVLVFVLASVNGFCQTKEDTLQITTWNPFKGGDHEYFVIHDSLFENQGIPEVYDYLHETTIEITTKRYLKKLLPSEMDSVKCLRDLVNEVKELDCPVLDGYALTIKTRKGKFKCYNCSFCMDKSKKEEIKAVERLHRLAYAILQ